MDWLDLLAIQVTLKSLLQHHSSKTSILRHSAFFMVQLQHPYVITWKTTVLTRQMQYLDAISKMTEWSLFPRQIIQYHSNPTSNAKEADVEWFYEDLQELLELTPPKDVLFIIGDWNAKVESQEIPGIVGKFDLGVQNKAGQRLTDFCQGNTLVIANTHFQ